MGVIKFVYGLVYLALLPLPVIAQAETALDKLTVMALAPLDGRAVVKGGDGTLHLVQRGDVIYGTTATLLQVLPDKLVVQEHSTQSGGISDTHVVWIYQSLAANGYAGMVRLQSTVPIQPLIPSMMTIPIPKP